jgi:hypothetical protein
MKRYKGPRADGFEDNNETLGPVTELNYNLVLIKEVSRCDIQHPVQCNAMTQSQQMIRFSAYNDLSKPAYIREPTYFVYVWGI